MAMRAASWVALLATCSELAASPSSPSQQEDAVRQLLQRRLPSHADKFALSVQPPPASAPLEQAFSVAAGTAAGTVALTGSSGVALASALNHYLKYDAGIQINVWFTSQTQPAGGSAAELPPPTPANITSPYVFQNYLNICAFGYSTAWYGWDRWQAEVDWMALNGVVNPLVSTHDPQGLKERIFQLLYLCVFYLIFQYTPLAALG